MEKRQRLSEICRIFNEIVEEKVKAYFVSPLDSKITFFNVKGDMVFLDQYKMIGDGDGGNVVISNIEGRNTYYATPTFIIPSDSEERANFVLHLEHPKATHSYSSYFIKENEEGERIYRLDREDILENEEFKGCIVEMLKDIAPERVDEIKKLVS